MEHNAIPTKRDFEPLFNPRSIVFLGASKDPRKWGFVTLNNIVKGGFEGKIYPVNPKEDSIFGLDVYKSPLDIPDKPDLAVIVVPPQSVVKVVEDCVAKGVRAGIIITAGFAEIGEEGRMIQQEMVRVARRGGMILVGPNCNGVTNPWHKLYAQFPSNYSLPGPIALITQSGNILDSIMRQVMLKGYGFSKLVSAGNQADLSINDYLQYLADDTQTKVILSYIEGFRDGQRFFEIASKVSRKKPIVMLKAGGSSAGAQAAMSHTASIAGSDEVFNAICKQSGIIRVKELDELLNVGIAFLRQPLPQGRRVGIVTGGGGWGVLAADACAELGLDVVSLPDETIRKLDAFLPVWWNRGNPVDLVAGVRGDTVFDAVESLLRSSSIDAVMMMSIMPAVVLPRVLPSAGDEEKKLIRESMVPVTVNVMERFAKLAEEHSKPVVVASELMFADGAAEIEIVQALGRTNCVCYRTPHQAARVLEVLCQYGEYRRRKGI